MIRKFDRNNLYVRYYVTGGFDVAVAEVDDWTIWLEVREGEDEEWEVSVEIDGSDVVLAYFDHEPSIDEVVTFTDEAIDETVDWFETMNDEA